MWHDIVSQLETTAELLSLSAVDLFYRFPLVFSGTVLATTTLTSLLCFEIRKAEKLQAQWDAERARYDRPVRIRR